MSIPEQSNANSSLPKQPTNPTSPPNPSPLNTSSPTSTKPPTLNTSNGNINKPKPIELTGFRSALSHTGIPHSVLTYKPKLPSRNWLIFWTLTTSISLSYYYDRRECKRIKEETINKVKDKGNEILKGGSLGLNRKIIVYGAKWPGDEDTDRSLRYFRKYVKPYLVAAGIDYELPTSPLHGSITRQIHSKILKERRQELGLEEIEPQLSLPGILSPEEYKKRELEGGIILVGRASFKEYMEGLKRGYMGKVDSWKWEDEIENKLEKDGIFDDNEPILSESKDLESTVTVEQEKSSNALSSSSSSSSIKSTTGLGFLSKSPIQTSNSTTNIIPSSIPEKYHEPKLPLPEQPPILLLPFINYIGFKQIPYMLLSFFTERFNVKQGSEAALSIINNKIRKFKLEENDLLNFDLNSENFYNSDSKDLINRIELTRKEYYENLKERIKKSKEYENGERQLNSEEEKLGKVISLKELKEERKKKELRWMGNLEGWNIIKPENQVTWDDRWNNWLNVFELPKDDE
ncbi:uncharacterized protein I206_100857 [Kwoniella pini CBS 10737]|uniref:Mitochondrial import inner membrane translocase subunit TIM54 n=1 Tax=Kwoniella pini CBS 10737 TaxID=1296096 RepID=A0A1B9IBY7_9TREE|nr:uncharacterized protein I206_00469 [Kwoniella pini CBS 10737]OCF53168.1 hypothetical protein I206_00469 [Kwoniella pini CBS 10737]